MPPDRVTIRPRPADEPPKGSGPTPGSSGPGAREVAADTARRVRHIIAMLGLVVLAVLLTLLVLRNTDRVTVDWIAGSARTSVVWIILAAAVIGWLAGILTVLVFARRRRRS